MATQENHAEPAISIDSSCTAARIVIPKNCPESLMTVQQLIILARERGVEITAQVEQTFLDIIQSFKENPQTLSTIFLRATPPKHGEDAYLEWNDSFNPDKADDLPLTDNDETADFYASHCFIAVSQNDCLGIVHKATPGVDGRDVTGSTIPAKPGKPLHYEIHPSIKQQADGKLIAQNDGLLKVQHNHISVEPLLEIQNSVDFSTGNIDFDGDVIIRHDIRDHFKVKATKNITVDGLIDACYLSCQGDLIARRGIAGRGEGTIAVDGDAHIGYLDQVRGYVAGTLYVSHEIMHSNLWVGTQLKAGTSSIIGGRIVVAGNVRLSQLGSNADTPTTLVLSDQPDELSPLGQVLKAMADHDRASEAISKELMRLMPAANLGDANARCKMDELTSSLNEHACAMQDLKKQHPQLAQPIVGNCPYTLEITRKIHARSTLTIGSHSATFKDDLKGPLRIWLDRSDTLMSQIGDAKPTPLRSHRAVSALTAA